MVGLTTSIYLNDDNRERFERESNKSGLINDLLSDYYSQDLDYLVSRSNVLTGELEAVNSKISVLKKKSETRTVKMIAERKRISEEHVEKEAKMRDELIGTLNRHHLSEYLYYDLRRAVVGKFVNANNYIALLKEKYGTKADPTKEFKKFLKVIKSSPNFEKNYGWVKE